MQQSIIQNWICGECAAILRAENAETRSTAMAQLSVDQLCLLLKHVVERMREYPGVCTIFLFILVYFIIFLKLNSNFLIIVRTILETSRTF